MERKRAMERSRETRLRSFDFSTRGKKTSGLRVERVFDRVTIFFFSPFPFLLWALCAAFNDVRETRDDHDAVVQREVDRRERERVRGKERVDGTGRGATRMLREQKRELD